MLPHHRLMCSGLLIASKTRRRGASNRRVMRISRSGGVVTLKVSLFLAACTAMSLLLGLQRLQIVLEPIEPRLPHRPVALGPLRNLLERRSLETAGTPLRVAAAADQAGPLQHAE